MQGYTNREVESLKAFLSRQVDGPVRLAYARTPVEVPRQFILCGTTNRVTEYLRDSTGNRRFWPVLIQQFGVEAIKRDRDQLWAEAVVREAQNVSIRLPESLWAVAAREQEARRAVDPWEELIEDALGEDIKTRDAILVEELWTAIGDAGKFYKVNDAERLARIMPRLGFNRKKKVTKVHVNDNGGREEIGRRWAWIREGTDPAEAVVVQGPLGAERGGSDDFGLR